MPHVSTDGPARPPYVNVAFQQEETELEEGEEGCCCSCWLLASFVTCTRPFFIFSDNLKNGSKKHPEYLLLL